MFNKQFLFYQLQNQLRNMNPTMYQQFLKMQKQNPRDVLNEITGKYTPEQLDQFKKYLNGFGIKDEQLQQYGINTIKSVDIN